MPILYLSACLRNIWHTFRTEIIELGIRGRFVITTLVGSREQSVIFRNDIIFQFSHSLKFHPRNRSECLTCLTQGIFRRTFQRFTILIEIRTEHWQCGQFRKRVYKSGPETRHYIQITATGLYKRKQAGTIYAFTTCKYGIKVCFIIDDKVQCLQSPVCRRIHEVHHTNVILLYIGNNVCFRKFGSRFLKGSHQ